MIFQIDGVKCYNFGDTLFANKMVLEVASYRFEGFSERNQTFTEEIMDEDGKTKRKKRYKKLVKTGPYHIFKLRRVRFDELGIDEWKAHADLIHTEESEDSFGSDSDMENDDEKGNMDSKGNQKTPGVDKKSTSTKKK